MPTKHPQLKVEKRKIFGRKVKSLRKQGVLPANLYGKNVKSQALQIPQKEFLKVFNEVGETGLVQLLIGGEKTPRTVLIHNLQQEPVSNSPVHLDFRQVDLKQKITAAVPIVMEGEAPAVATGGVLLQLMNEVEVEALPTDLPENITIKIASLEQIGQSLSVADLLYDKSKVQLKIEDPKALVVKIEAPAKEEVEVKPEVVPEEGAAEEGAAEGEKREAKEAGEEKPQEAAKTEEKK